MKVAYAWPKTVWFSSTVAGIAFGGRIIVIAGDRGGFLAVARSASVRAVFDVPTVMGPIHGYRGMQPRASLESLQARANNDHIFVIDPFTVE